MKKLCLVVVVTSALFGACKKKDEAPKAGSAAAEPAPTGSAPAPTPAEPAAPADPAAAGSAAAPAGSAAPVDVGALKAVPAGVPASCTDARKAVEKIVTCDKFPDRENMVTMWNNMVTGSLERWGDADDKQKATIEKSCASMVQTGKMAEDLCK